MNLPETCIHCNLPIPPIDGEDLHFCCHGCEGAYRIIKGAGLEDFYTKRNWQDHCCWKESGALPVSGLLSVSSPGSTVSWK
jgi:hypothetical protein